MTLGRAVASILPKISGPGPRPLSALYPPKPLRLGRDPSKPKRVFPSSNFDSPVPCSSEDVSGSEAKDDEGHKPARLAIHESEIRNYPDRTVMEITRGEFDELVKLGGFKRERKYFVSSDLSPQATYAMEWAVGTVLRDGDTLHVVQAMEKDNEPCGEDQRKQNCLAHAEETRQLLKRTKLQVKVIIEIVTAKVPKHMITEMVVSHVRAGLTID